MQGVASSNPAAPTTKFQEKGDVQIRYVSFFCVSSLGFETCAVRDGAGLFDALSRRKPSLILLDIMLPGEDGLSLCKRLRVPGSGFETVPIIFLRALGELADRVVGLEIGADDYLAKPFEMRELVARIRALLRRSSMSGTSETQHTTMYVPEEIAEIWKFGPWRINMAAHHLIDENDVAVALSANEFKLEVLPDESA